MFVHPWYEILLKKHRLCVGVIARFGRNIFGFLIFLLGLMILCLLVEYYTPKKIISEMFMFFLYPKFWEYFRLSLMSVQTKSILLKNYHIINIKIIIHLLGLLRFLLLWSDGFLEVFNVFWYLFFWGLDLF